MALDWVGLLLKYLIKDLINSISSMTKSVARGLGKPRDNMAVCNWITY